MTSILDKFQIAAFTTFRPKTVAELFALRLADKLGDAVAAAHYVGLQEQYSEAQLLSSFRRTINTDSHQDLGRRFQAELKQIRGNRPTDKEFNLIAIRVERRSVAVAVLYGDRLEYVQVRHLSSAKNKALGSAIAFIEWICDQFPIESAAMELISIEDEIQRKALSAGINHALRARLLPIWEIAKTDLFRAYGYPPLKSRKELRGVITRIWPSLEGTNSKMLIQDAVALGLYVQTERLFITN